MSIRAMILKALLEDQWGKSTHAVVAAVVACYVEKFAPSRDLIMQELGILHHIGIIVRNDTDGSPGWRMY